MKNIEMQGTVLAGLKCSVSIEKEKRIHTISFINIRVVSAYHHLIDEVIAVTSCSIDSVKTI